MPAAEGWRDRLGRQASEKPRGRKPRAGMGWGWRCRAGLWGFENGASGDVRMARSSEEAQGVSLRWRSTPLRSSACPWDVCDRARWRVPPIVGEARLLLGAEDQQRQGTLGRGDQTVTITSYRSGWAPLGDIVACIRARSSR